MSAMQQRWSAVEESAPTRLMRHWRRRKASPRSQMRAMEGSTKSHTSSTSLADALGPTLGRRGWGAGGRRRNTLVCEAVVFTHCCSDCPWALAGGQPHKKRNRRSSRRGQQMDTKLCRADASYVAAHMSRSPKTSEWSWKGSTANCTGLPPDSAAKRLYSRICVMMPWSCRDADPTPRRYSAMSGSRWPSSSARLEEEPIAEDGQQEGTDRQNRVRPRGGGDWQPLARRARRRASVDTKGTERRAHQVRATMALRGVLRREATRGVVRVVRQEASGGRSVQ